MALFAQDIRTDIEAQGTVREWTGALRSGEYQQGRGRLRSGGDAFCCMGVAVDRLAPHLWRIENSRDDHDHSGDAWTARGRVVSMPTMVARRLHLCDDMGTLDDDPKNTLAELNDQGHSFSFIADLIDAELQSILETK